MKQLWCGLLLSLLVFSARAQTAPAQRDGLTWVEGRLLLLRDGSTQPVTREVRLPSGTRILPSGHVILANGRQGRLMAGDGVNPQTGAWFARRAKNPDGTTFLPLPVRLELPSPALGKTGSGGHSSSRRRYHYEQRQQRTKDGRRLPDQDEEDDDED